LRGDELAWKAIERSVQSMRADIGWPPSAAVPFGVIVTERQAVISFPLAGPDCGLALVIDDEDTARRLLIWFDSCVSRIENESHLTAI
jgi:hypothetical protein